jgi:hypothetical protein
MIHLPFSPDIIIAVGPLPFCVGFSQWKMTGPVTASSPGRPRSTHPPVGILPLRAGGGPSSLATRLFIFISHTKWKRT